MENLLLTAGVVTFQLFSPENQSQIPRVLLLLIKTFGWLVAHTPELLLRLVAVALGDAVFFFLPRRRRLALSNLHHAFPEKPAAWHRATARAGFRRLIETGLLSLATPFLSEKRLRQIVTISPAMLAAYARHRANPAATLICSPHIAYWEVQTAQPLVVPGPFPEFGIIFRPLDHPAANAFVVRSRERFGMKLLSRKQGFAEALKILRRKGFVGVLFDQNAGLQGALTTLFDRVCSTTELPGLMAEKFKARVYGIFPRRLGFWRVEIGAKLIAHDNSSAGVTLALNRWLETLLRDDDDLCASWLWSHDRWRHQDMPPKRFHLESKRDLLPAELAAHGLDAPPRRTRLWIRLPNWLGDVVMVLPLLRALRVSRPDLEITLVAKKPFLPLLDSWAVADLLQALPPPGRGYFPHFWKHRHAYPDIYLLFTNSIRGDLEAFLTRAPQRFGLVRPGKLRPLLTHAYALPRDFDERTRHQLDLWENFLRHFGLKTPADRTPLLTPIAPFLMPLASIGLIPGSENTPKKRWPVEHWRALIDAFPGERFVIFGTSNDAPIAKAIADGYDSVRVENLSGRTSLPTYAARLSACRLLVTNDTGGLHLANALGVPLVGLFGPTNPLRTGPIFSTPFKLLQPPGCAPTGGGALKKLAPEIVAASVRDLLTTPPA